MFIEQRHIDTSRRADIQGKENYLNSLGFRNEDEFLEWLGEDTVLDMGSGYGTLAKNVAKKKGRAQVVSLNPSLENPDFLAESRLKTKELGGGSNTDIDFLDRAHESLAVAGRWDKLPFQDSAFPKIVSSYAFPMYCKTREELIATVKELKRVLRPGGEARINAPQAHSITDKKGAVVPRDSFYSVFKKMLESEGLIVKEMSEYSQETESLVRSLGGARLQTFDHPFFLSIKKPATDHSIQLN